MIEAHNFYDKFEFRDQHRPADGALWRVMGEKVSLQLVPSGALILVQEIDAWSQVTNIKQIPLS